MKFNSPYAEAWKYLITYLLRPPNYTRIRAERRRRAVAKRRSPALRADERKEAAFYSEVAAQPDGSRWEGPDEEEDYSYCYSSSELDAAYGRGAAAYVRYGFDPQTGRPPEDANPVRGRPPSPPPSLPPSVRPSLSPPSVSVSLSALMRQSVS